MYETRLSITDYQGNEKLKPQRDIALHLLVSKMQKQTSIGKIVQKREPCTLLQGMEVSAATWENSMEEALQKKQK